MLKRWFCLFPRGGHGALASGRTRPGTLLPSGVKCYVLDAFLTDEKITATDGVINKNGRDTREACYSNFSRKTVGVDPASIVAV